MERNKPEILETNEVGLAIGVSFTIADYAGPILFSGFLDLSNIQVGDTVEVIQKIAVGDSPQPFIRRVYSGMMLEHEKLVYFDEIFAPKRVQVMVKQLSGIPKKVSYTWFGR